MFSYEDRLRAVRLHFKLGKRIGLTIRQLGHPTKNVPVRPRPSALNQLVSAKPGALQSEPEGPKIELF